MSDIKYLVSRADWLEKEQHRLQKELLKVEKELAQIRLKIAKETTENLNVNEKEKSYENDSQR